MKFTHRSAGPRKGNGASPVTKVKRKVDSIVCSKCGEHRTKCTCDYSSRRKPFATLSDTDLSKAARKRYEVGQCVEVRMTGSPTIYSATVTEVNEDKWPMRIVLDSGWVLKHGDFVIRNSTWIPASKM